MGSRIEGEVDFGRFRRHIKLNLIALVFALVASSPVSAAEQPTNEQTVILATGDVMLGRSVNKLIEANNDDPTWPFQKMEDILRNADIRIINLEAPIVPDCPDSDVAANLKLCAPLVNAQGLKYAGIDVANLANNHRYDYGEAGYESTISILDQLGIDPSDEDHLAVITHNGTKYGFIGFNLIRQSSEMKILSPEEILKRVEDSNKAVDVLIVSMHWGIEYSSQPASNITQLAHELITEQALLLVITPM